MCGRASWRRWATLWGPAGRSYKYPSRSFGSAAPIIGLCIGRGREGGKVPFSAWSRPGLLSSWSRTRFGSASSSSCRSRTGRSWACPRIQSPTWTARPSASRSERSWAPGFSSSQWSWSSGRACSSAGRSLCTCTRRSSSPSSSGCRLGLWCPFRGSRGAAPRLYWWWVD